MLVSRGSLLLAPGLVALLMPSCKDSERCALTSPLCDIRTVAVEPGNVVLTSIGQTVELKVVARDADSLRVELGIVPAIWESESPVVATVDAAGVVTAVASGTAVIRATSDLVSDSSRSATITVDFSALPSQMAIITNPGGAVLNALLDPQPVIQLRNSNGDLVSSTMTVSVQKASGPGTLNGITSVPAVGGVATFSNLRITGTAGSHTLRILALGLPDVVSPAFEVTTPPPATSINFAADWSTATGYSSNAVTDGGKWPRMVFWTGTGTPSTNGRVVSIATEGLSGFPPAMPNALKVSFAGNPRPVPDGSPGFVNVFKHENKWPLPAVGETLFQRFYLYNAIRNAVSYPAGGGNHQFQGFEDTGATSVDCTHAWNYKWGSNSNGTFDILLNWYEANITTPPKGQFALRGLPKFTAQLIEVAHTKIAVDTFIVRVRINGVDRTSEFRGGDNLEYRLSDYNIKIVEYCLGGLWLGNNDPNPPLTGANPSLDFIYFGGVAVAVRADASAWIGPWVP